MKLLLNSLFTLFIAVTIVPSLGAQQKPQQEQIVENFDDNQRRWYTRKYNGQLYQVKDGFYHIRSRKLPTGISYDAKYFFIDTQQDFALETSVVGISATELRNKTGAGLIWGMSDQDNFYRFIIATDGKFNIGKYEQERDYNLTEWVKSTAIKVGNNVANVLKISKDKQGVKFYINEKLVHRISLPDFQKYPFYGNKVGLMAGDVRYVKFDYLKIKRFKRPINLVPNAGQGYKKENLGAQVNENSREITPIISADGKTLYFIRNYHPKNVMQTREDAWFSTLDKQGKWSKAKNLGKPINNINHNGVLAVSPDGNSLLLGGTYYPDGRAKGDGLSLTHRTKSGWAIPEALRVNGYYNNYNQYWASLSLDRQKLFLAVQRRDSYGESDLYISFLQSDGSWSTPKNLGKTINTGAKESSPFLSADNQTLYFSSSGHPGYGQADVFMSRRLDDTWTRWSKPQNLGKSINTGGTDEDFVITAKGDYAYLSSYVSKSKRTDLFRVKMSTAAKPKPVVMIYGKVLNNKTKVPLKAKITYQDLNTGKVVGIAQSNPKDGSYKIVLPQGKVYGFLADKDGFYSVSNHLDLNGLNKFKEIKRDLYLAPIRIGANIRLNNLFFATGKSTLQTTSYGELNRLIQSLKRYPNMTIEIAGHTDNQGNSAKNRMLSKARANAVRDYLTSKGVPASRLKAKGYGQTKPIANNNSVAGRARNRRVEFIILAK